MSIHININWSGATIGMLGVVVVAVAVTVAVVGWLILILILMPSLVEVDVYF